MYIKYKTHNTVYTQHNQLNKNTLKHGSSASGARDLLNLLSDVKSMLLGSATGMGNEEIKLDGDGWGRM